MSQTMEEKRKELEKFMAEYKVEPIIGEIKDEPMIGEPYDMVLKPPHYNQGGIETIDYMKAYSTKEEFMGHCRLTAIKYLSRLMEKENPLQDAQKAHWYLNKLIDELS